MNICFITVNPRLYRCLKTLLKKKLIQMSQVANIEKIGMKNTENYVCRIMI